MLNSESERLLMPGEVHVSMQHEEKEAVQFTVSNWIQTGLVVASMQLLVPQYRYILKYLNSEYLLIPRNEPMPLRHFPQI